MSDADEAFAFAEKLIEEARESGARALSFDRSETRALERLPESISTLTKLSVLDLDNMQVSDVSALSGLSGLSELYLNYTQVIDVSALSGLSGLSELYLRNTRVSDVSALSGLSGLSVLSLHNTPVSDVSALSGLNGLSALYLNGTQVSDVSALSGLSGLSVLYLNRTQVSDVSALSGLSGLSVLSLDNTQVSDVSVLSGLSGLLALDLDNALVSDLRPLSGLTRLVDEPNFGGLGFQGCRATEIDARINEISEIEDARERARALFDYLEDWVPPGEVEDLPPLSLEGFEVEVVDGKIAFHQGSDDQDAQTSALYDLIRVDLNDMLEACPSGHNAPFPELRAILDKYDTALGAGLDELISPALWNEGNKLRLEVKSDEDKPEIVLDGAPKLTTDLSNRLQALLALHNAFVSGHEALAALEKVRVDEIDRQKAGADHQALGVLVEQLAPQLKLIVEEVVAEFQTLHGLSDGDSEFARRALGVERESLDNLINRAVRQALIDEKSDDSLTVVAGDVRSATVGAVVGSPVIAATFPQLLSFLEPQLAAFLAAQHGAGYPVKDSMDWVVNKVRDRVRRHMEDEGEPNAR
ncbi:MAG: leucine-rich repeat domain-containing protein [Pseudomonadota bacterium]